MVNTNHSNSLCMGLVFLKIIYIAVVVSLCTFLVSCGKSNSALSDEGNDYVEENIESYSYSISRINTSLDRFGSNPIYANGKFLFLDNVITGKMIEYDPTTGAETTFYFNTSYVAYDGDFIYYFSNLPVEASMNEASFELHRYCIEDSTDDIIYKVPRNYMNLYELKCTGRYLSWCEQKLDDFDGVVINDAGGLEAIRVRAKVMDVDTSSIICDMEIYTFSPYKSIDVSKEGVLIYMTRLDDEYTYHAINIENKQELWKKEHLENPLTFGAISEKYIAYCYTCGIGGIDRVFKVDSLQSGKEVYTGGGIRSSVFFGNCLVTGFNGGFQLIDLQTGKRTGTCRDLEELAPQRYLYAGWITEMDDNHFIFVREDPQRESVQDQYGGKSRDAFIAKVESERQN